LPLPLYDEGVDAKGKYLPQPIPEHVEFAELLQRFIHASVLTTGTIYSHTEAKKLRRGLAKSL
jgi:hypothetical protein